LEKPVPVPGLIDFDRCFAHGVNLR
jgi:hypothetical protein